LSANNYYEPPNPEKLRKKLIYTETTAVPFKLHKKGTSVEKSLTIIFLQAKNLED